MSDVPKPIWKITLTPIAMTQSTTRKAKIRGIELMYKLKNHLRPCRISLMHDGHARLCSRKGSHGDLNVHALEMLMYHRQTSSDQSLKYSLVQQRSFHRGTTRASSTSAQRKTQSRVGHLLTCSNQELSGHIALPTARTPVLRTYNCRVLAQLYGMSKLSLAFAQCSGNSHEQTLKDAHHSEAD